MRLMAALSVSNMKKEMSWARRFYNLEPSNEKVMKKNSNML